MAGIATSEIDEQTKNDLIDVLNGAADSIDRLLSGLDSRNQEHGADSELWRPDILMATDLAKRSAEMAANDGGDSVSESAEAYLADIAAFEKQLEGTADPKRLASSYLGRRSEKLREMALILGGEVAEEEFAMATFDAPSTKTRRKGGGLLGRLLRRKPKGYYSRSDKYAGQSGSERIGRKEKQKKGSSVLSSSDKDEAVAEDVPDHRVWDHANEAEEEVEEEVQEADPRGEGFKTAYQQLEAKAIAEREEAARAAEAQRAESERQRLLEQLPDGAMPVKVVEAGGIATQSHPQVTYLPPAQSSPQQVEDELPPAALSPPAAPPPAAAPPPPVAPPPEPAAPAVAEQQEPPVFEQDAEPELGSAAHPFDEVSDADEFDGATDLGASDLERIRPMLEAAANRKKEPRAEEGDSDILDKLFGEETGEDVDDLMDLGYFDHQDGEVPPYPNTADALDAEEASPAEPEPAFSLPTSADDERSVEDVGGEAVEQAFGTAGDSWGTSSEMSDTQEESEGEQEMPDMEADPDVSTGVDSPTVETEDDAAEDQAEQWAASEPAAPEEPLSEAGVDGSEVGDVETGDAEAAVVEDVDAGDSSDGGQDDPGDGEDTDTDTDAAIEEEDIDGDAEGIDAHETDTDEREGFTEETASGEEDEAPADDESFQADSDIDEEEASDMGGEVHDARDEHSDPDSEPDGDSQSEDDGVLAEVEDPADVWQAVEDEADAVWSDDLYEEESGFPEVAIAPDGEPILGMEGSDADTEGSDESASSAPADDLDALLLPSISIEGTTPTAFPAAALSLVGCLEKPAAGSGPLGAAWAAIGGIDDDVLDRAQAAVSDFAAATRLPEVAGIPNLWTRMAAWGYLAAKHAEESGFGWQLSSWPTAVEGDLRSDGGDGQPFVEIVPVWRWPDGIYARWDIHIPFEGEHLPKGPLSSVWLPIRSDSETVRGDLILETAESLSRHADDKQAVSEALYSGLMSIEPLLTPAAKSSRPWAEAVSVLNEIHACNALGTELPDMEALLDQVADRLLSLLDEDVPHGETMAG